MDAAGWSSDEPHLNRNLNQFGYFVCNTGKLELQSWNMGANPLSSVVTSSVSPWNRTSLHVAFGVAAYRIFRLWSGAERHKSPQLKSMSSVRVGEMKQHISRSITGRDAAQPAPAPSALTRATQDFTRDRRIGMINGIWKDQTKEDEKRYLKRYENMKLFAVHFDSTSS